MAQDDTNPRTFTVSAWRNGKLGPSGTGYGLKVRSKDRDAFFVREWDSIYLHLDREPADEIIEVNIDKNSMWHGNCRELIHKNIGAWLMDNNLAPWEWRDNPKNITVEWIKDRNFKVWRPSPRQGIPVD